MKRLKQLSFLHCGVLLTSVVTSQLLITGCNAAPTPQTSTDPATNNVAKPGPTNTGPKNKAALKPINGMTVIQDSTVLENVAITGMVTIKANNVTIRNFLLDAKEAHYGIRATNGNTGLRFEDGEIINFASAGILGNGFTATALNIHESGGDGVKVQGAGGPSLVERCWIHHLGKKEGAHADGNQTIGGQDITFRHNFIDMPADPPPPYKANANFILQTKTGPISNFLAESNWLNGGGWTIYAPTKNGTNIRFINNKFGRDYKYGIITGKEHITFTGNVWEDTGEPIEFNERGLAINPHFKKATKNEKKAEAQ